MKERIEEWAKLLRQDGIDSKEIVRQKMMSCLKDWSECNENNDTSKLLSNRKSRLHL